MGKWRQGAIRSPAQGLTGWDLSLRGLAPAPVFIPNTALNCLELLASKVTTEMDLEIWRRGRDRSIFVDSREKAGGEEVESVWGG